MVYGQKSVKLQLSSNHGLKANTGVKSFYSLTKLNCNTKNQPQNYIYNTWVKKYANLDQKACKSISNETCLAITCIFNIHYKYCSTIRQYSKVLGFLYPLSPPLWILAMSSFVAV